jgi:hypothetical protein
VRWFTKKNLRERRFTNDDESSVWYLDYSHTEGVGGGGGKTNETNGTALAFQLVPTSVKEMGLCCA